MCRVSVADLRDGSLPLRPGHRLDRRSAGRSTANEEVQPKCCAIDDIRGAEKTMLKPLPTCECRNLNDAGVSKPGWRHKKSNPVWLAVF